ncbi:hypothetical protein evm_010081 [Chilo suppressalis]|nr:hypothetical protein evm_010081 [Chilo suppressalis]
MGPLLYLLHINDLPNIHHHHQPINVPTAGAQAFPMDGIGRLGHDPPRGPSADWRVLITADAAGANGLTCLPKHGGARDTNRTIGNDNGATCCINSSSCYHCNHFSSEAFLRWLTTDWLPGYANQLISPTDSERTHSSRNYRR